MSDRHDHTPRTVGDILAVLGEELRAHRATAHPRVTAAQNERIRALINGFSAPAHAEPRPSHRRPDRSAQNHASSAPVPARTPATPPARRSQHANTPSRNVSDVPQGAGSRKNGQKFPWMVDETAASHDSAARGVKNQDARTHSAEQERSAKRIDSSDEKKARLDAMYGALANADAHPLCAPSSPALFGAGDPDARLLLLAEFPGPEDEANGALLSDGAGALLTKMLEAMGLGRDGVYLTTILKRRPKHGRAATREELLACAPTLRSQIETVDPDVILALGTVPSRLLLKRRFRFSEQRGTWQSWRGYDVMATWHPAHLEQHPQDKRGAWQDLQKVMQKLGL